MKKRLVYITASMPFGSGEEFLVAEAKELMRQGCRLLIVPRSPKGKISNQDATELKEHSVRRRLLSPRVLAEAGLECLRHPIAVGRTIALLFKCRDLGVLAKNLAVLPKGLWLARLADRWRADHLHAHWGRTTATMAMIASKVSGVPWSLTLHRDDIAHPNLLGAKMTDASFTRFISRSGMDIARDMGVPVPARGVCLVHMGVTQPQVAVGPPLDRAAARILCPASLIPVKGHEYLIEALGLLRDHGSEFELTLAGDGYLRQTLQARVAALALTDRVIFLGQVPHERIMSWYERGDFDIVVLPSIDLGNHTHEGIPVSLMEAMAHGIPVIATETGGIPELLAGGAGVLIPPEDAVALAVALEELIRDPSRRSQLGKAGRQRITEEYSVDQTAAALIACVEYPPDRLPADLWPVIDRTRG
jgi:glycosyltransferase involved in cell wall biosynthesis